MKSLKSRLKAQLHDQRGILIADKHAILAHSLIIQLIQGLYIQMAQTNLPFVDTSDVTNTAGTHSQNNLACDAGPADTAKGIVIGSGTAAVTMTDRHLQSQLTTDIAHSGTIFALETPDASTTQLTITRAFTNNTGSQFSVSEVGLYAVLYDTWNGNKNTCFDRSLYAIDVPAATTLTLTYTIQVSL